MLLLGAIPGEAQALSDAFGDKLLHLCAYSFLTCVLFGGMSGNIAARAWRTLMLIGLLGGVDETIQGFMAYRNPSMGDWLIDILAAGLTLIALVILARNMHRMTSTPARRHARPGERR